MRGELVDRHGNAMTVIGIVYIDPRDHWQRTMGLTHPDFPAAVEALKALVPEPFGWDSHGECGSGAMNIRDIVREYLVAHGHDGLTTDANWDSCGCGVDDLMPCGDPNSRCQPARRVMWDTCPWRENGCPEWESAETCPGCYTIEERGQDYNIEEV